MERAITKQFSKSAYVLMAPFLRPILKKAVLTQLELWALAILREIVVAYAVNYRTDGPLQDLDRNRSKVSCTYHGLLAPLPPKIFRPSAGSVLHTGCLAYLATGRIIKNFFFYYIFVSC